MSFALTYIHISHRSQRIQPSKVDSNLASVMGFWRLSLITLFSFPALLLHPHHLLDNSCLSLARFFPIPVQGVAAKIITIIFYSKYFSFQHLEPIYWLPTYSPHLSPCFYLQDAAQNRICFGPHPLFLPFFFLFFNISHYCSLCLPLPVLDLLLTTPVSWKYNEIQQEENIIFCLYTVVSPF